MKNSPKLFQFEFNLRFTGRYFHYATCIQTKLNWLKFLLLSFCTKTQLSKCYQALASSTFTLHLPSLKFSNQ